MKYFLEQCLISVEKAIRVLEGERMDLTGGRIGQSELARKPDWITGPAEIIVFDNHSGDGSLEFLRPRFPNVQFIENQENIGFSKANNRALELARGKYILFLNPDTILPEDCLSIGVSFLDSTPDSGAVGVRMIDGTGLFLKESKRGFPTPWVAFCKLFGLTALFPDSSLLAGYYLGHLSEHRDQPADILSGAFLLTSRRVLEKTGGFDERFFMYAEDIDLSYRIKQAGYTNYYLASTTIVHFKGESTQKDIRYVKLFYKAMSQFRRKHFRGFWSRIFNGLLEFAIWCRAGMTALWHMVRPQGGRGAVIDSSIATDRSAAPAIPDHRRPDGQTIPLVRVEGDPIMVDILKGSLFSSQSAVRFRGDGPAAEIIFCEGPCFSFKEIIKALQSRDPGLGKTGGIVKIHASGSSSVIGSRSKDGRGETIVL